MEIIAILFLIVILVILLNQGGTISRQFSRLEAEIHMLRQQVHNMSKIAESKAVAEPLKEQPKPVAQQQWETGFKVVPEKPAIPEPQPEPVKEAAEPVKEIIPEKPMPIEQKPIPTYTVEGTITTPGTNTNTAKPVPKPAPKSRDMEKFIGENLVSKIGIAVLVIAIGFFVKYAIDNNWVGEVGRVAIGVLCGGILIALAHKMRNSYRAFSSVLAGGGLAVLYFTITLACKQFHLFDQATAFIIMICITAFAAVLSLLYNKQELAITALVGGFAAPLLVSSGENHYQTLFIYLIILNAGIVVIAYNKAWRLLNLLAFIFTVLFFGTWLVFNADRNVTNIARNGFIFATIFYVLFFIINIAHNVRENKKFIASDFGILLANTCLYFSAGLYCMEYMGASGYRGIFSAAMGLFNLVAAYFFFRKQKVDANILYLLIGITLSFVSLTAPLQLHGNHITLFWATETVLLYWLFTKSKIKLVYISSVAVWAAMLISLVWDWGNIYGDAFAQLPVIINKGFVTSIFAAVATYMLFILKYRAEKITPDTTLWPGKNILRIVAIVLLYAAGVLEIHHQFNYYYLQTGLHLQYILLYTALFILTASLLMQKIKKLQVHLYVQAAMLAAGILLYLLSIPGTYQTQWNIFAEPKLAGHFMVHWLAAAAVAALLLRLISMIRKTETYLAATKDLFTWIGCIVTVIFLSVEIHFLVNAFFYSSSNPLEQIERVYIKTGLPILWGLCSFAFMWLGMRHKYRTLRIVSLTLFTITLFKLFIFDIRNIPPAGKIAAFFCLGVLLLVVSFMYQRLKKIIIDDEKNNG
jgi:uncharacterized membrane protein